MGGKVNSRVDAGRAEHLVIDMLKQRGANDRDHALHTSYGDLFKQQLTGANRSPIDNIGGNGADALRDDLAAYAKDGFSTDEVTKLAQKLGCDSGATDALLGAFDVRDQFLLQDEDGARSAVRDFDRDQGHGQYSTRLENGAVGSSTDISSDADIDKVVADIKNTIGNDPAKVRERIHQIAQNNFRSQGNWSIGGHGLDAVPADKLQKMRDDLEQRLLRACGL